MNGTAAWVLGALVGLGGLFGLFLASRAADPTFHLFGLALTGAAVLYGAALVRRHFDEAAALRRSASAK